ncbi:MAG: N(G),N(G)-dimethylarginine dimethylaminohydrolase [Myxococcales bacterium]|nr:N(G),N(G)-dimethylarginine dimethylaminohydrolase [Myxococcales bacterium]
MDCYPRRPVVVPPKPATPRRAWVRAPGDAYVDCLRTHPEGAPDVARALDEHEGYVRALEDAGVEVVRVPAAEGLPDACFVEDVAVVLDHEVAVLTRPGAPSRRLEVADLAPRLAASLVLWPLRAAATLDGGDVLRLGARLLVGRSRRTNREGIEQLRGFATPRGLEVVEVEVARGLHLKSACTALDAHTVVVDPDALDPAVLERLDLTVHPVPEPLGANVLAFEDRVLVSAAAPRTADGLEARGWRVVRICVGEFHRGDGALSCLSLRQPPEGGWSV